MRVEIPADLMWKARAQAIVQDGCETVGMDVAQNIIVVLCPRKRTTAGTAYTHYGKTATYKDKDPRKPLQGRGRGGAIKLALRLFERLDEDECINTILHELAHILANLKHGGQQQHNYRWRAMFRRIGENYGIMEDDITVCHNYDVSDLKRPNNRWHVICPANCGWTYKITTNRKTRRIKAIRKGRWSYCCPVCKKNLPASVYEGATELP